MKKHQRATAGLLAAALLFTLPGMDSLRVSAGWGEHAAETVRAEELAGTELSAAVHAFYKGTNLQKAQEKEFGTKKLIINTSLENPDPCGAEECISLGDGLYALSYGTEAEAGNAYEAYRKMEGIQSVEADAVVKIQTEKIQDDRKNKSNEVKKAGNEAGDREINPSENLQDKKEPEGTEGQKDADSRDEADTSTASSDGQQEKEGGKTADPQKQPGEEGTDSKAEVPSGNSEKDARENQAGEDAEASTEQAGEDHTVRVALIDSGIQPDIAGLAPYIEETGTNLSGSGEEGSTTDDHGHGTQMAQVLVSALEENGKNSDSVKILPIKILNKDGQGTVLSAYLAIQQAMEQGADIINLSLSSKCRSELLEKAIREADERGILVAGAAGNDGEDASCHTPGSSEEAVVVSAALNREELEETSNHGKTIDFCAYGTREALDLSGNPITVRGTSVACAYVTGTAASLEKGLSNPERINALKERSTDLGEPGRDGLFGEGLIGDAPKKEKEPEENADPEKGDTGNDGNPGKEDTTATGPVNLDHNIGPKLLELDWKGLEAEELDAYLSDTDSFYVGWFLSSLSEEEMELLKKKSKIVHTDITEGTYHLSGEGGLEFQQTDCATKNFTAYCLEKYEKNKDLITASGIIYGDWVIGDTNKGSGIGTCSGAFAISCPHHKCVYLMKMSGFNEKSYAKLSDIGYDGRLDPPARDEIRITKTVVKDSCKSCGNKFNVSVPTSLQYYIRSLRAEQVHYHKEEDGEWKHMLTSTQCTHAYTGTDPLGNGYYNNSGLISYGLSIKFQGNNVMKSTGYHVESDIKNYQFYKYSDWKNKNRLTKMSEAMSLKSLETYNMYGCIGGRLKDKYNTWDFAGNEDNSGTDDQIYAIGSSDNITNSRCNEWVREHMTGDYSWKQIKNAKRATGKSSVSHNNDTGKVSFTLNSPLYKSMGTTVYNTKWENDRTVIDRDDPVMESDVPLITFMQPNTYMVKYLKNGATSGSTAASKHTYDKEKELNTNGFVRSFNVEFYDNYNDMKPKEKTVSSSFRNWNTEKDGTGTAYKNRQSVKNLTDANADIIKLYAQWKDATITLPSREREGYDFLGWNTDQEKAEAGEIKSGYTAGSKVTISKDTKLYAAWEKKTYEITYDANGGSGTMEAGKKTHGEDYVIKDNAFIRDGYDFEGWSTKEEGPAEETYAPGKKYEADAPLTLYAQWKENFKVAYMGNRQTRGMDFIDGGEDGYGYSEKLDYAFDDNTEAEETEETAGNMEEHFQKAETVTYEDEETGETVEQKVEGTVVGWAMAPEDTEGTNDMYKLGETVPGGELVANAQETPEAFTIGAPNSDFGKSDSLVAQSMNSVRRVSAAAATIPSLEGVGNVYHGTPYVNLYAVWNMGPVIEAYDRYYTIEEAQSGFITEEELLNVAKATDEELKGGSNEDGRLKNFVDEENQTSFTVMDYQAEEFTDLTGSAVISVTYRAEDAAGNITKKRILVHIVDGHDTIIDGHDIGREPEEPEGRFISEKYLDTLEEDSIWRTDPEYRELLEKTVKIKRINPEQSDPVPLLRDDCTIDIPGTGEWSETPQSVWSFTREQVKESQKFVEEYGPANYVHEDGLKKYYEKFRSCRTVP